ncbi:tetratricopeptide repeat protein [Providencia rettgeri]
MQLGFMYGDSNGYVKEDYKKSKYWFEKSAAQGNADANYFLGLLYLTGNGVEKDKSKANKLFKKSCSLGSNKACDRLEE